MGIFPGPQHTVQSFLLSLTPKNVVWAPTIPSRLARTESERRNVVRVKGDGLQPLPGPHFSRYAWTAGMKPQMVLQHLRYRFSQQKRASSAYSPQRV